MSIISFFWLLWCIYLFWKKNNKFDGIRKEFIVYLEAKNDIETLYKMREYNEYGYKERRRAPGTLIALQSKYKKTNDKKYKEYADSAVEATWGLIILGLGIFIGVSIFLSSLYSLFSKTLS
ncbi:MAG: hypothetical protein LBC31_08825 [Treponema sp.]|jgi:lysozyme family protein|nr:hypothetical protein [Treponema sp.]